MNFGNSTKCQSEPSFTGLLPDQVLILGRPRGDKRPCHREVRDGSAPLVSFSNSVAFTCPSPPPPLTHPARRRRSVAEPSLDPASLRLLAALGVGAGNSRGRPRRWSRHRRPPRLQQRPPLPSPCRACSLSARSD